MDRSGEYNAASGMALLAGALTVIGCFMPWLSVDTATSSESRSGLDHGGGKVALIVGLLVLVVGAACFLGARLPQGAVKLSLLGLGAVALVIAGLNVLDVRDKAAEVTDDFVKGSVEMGVWLVMAGAVLTIAAGTLMPARADAA